MPIRLASDPPDGRGAILRALLAVSPASSHKGPRLAVQRIARSVRGLQVALPLPVYAIGADRLDEDKDLSTARQLGWQYLLVRGERPVAIAEVTVDSDSRSRVTGIVTGRRCVALAAAIERLEKMPDEKLDGELRLLWSPGACERALWLHSSRGTDRVLPLNAVKKHVSRGTR
jgi:hypothetical protein